MNDENDIWKIKESCKKSTSNFTHFSSAFENFFIQSVIDTKNWLIFKDFLWNAMWRQISIWILPHERVRKLLLIFEKKLFKYKTHEQTLYELFRFKYKTVPRITVKFEISIELQFTLLQNWHKTQVKRSFEVRIWSKNEKALGVPARDIKQN